jgi:hypothetical protein
VSQMGQFPGSVPPPYPPMPYAKPEQDRQELRLIAGRQKAVLICILVNILCLVGQFLVAKPVRPMVGLVFFASCVVAAVFLFMLAVRLYGTGVGVILGILSLIPYLGLIPLAIVNSKATRILKDNSIHVGVMGADMSSL